MPGKEPLRIEREGLWVELLIMEDGPTTSLEFGLQLKWNVWDLPYVGYDC